MKINLQPTRARKQRTKSIVGTPEGKKLIGRTRCRCDNIKINLKEIRREDVDSTQLAYKSGRLTRYYTDSNEVSRPMQGAEFQAS